MDSVNLAGLMILGILSILIIIFHIKNSHIEKNKSYNQTYNQTFFDTQQKINKLISNNKIEHLMVLKSFINYHTRYNSTSVSRLDLEHEIEDLYFYKLLSRTKLIQIEIDLIKLGLMECTTQAKTIIDITRLKKFDGVVYHHLINKQCIIDLLENYKISQYHDTSKYQISQRNEQDKIERDAGLKALEILKTTIPISTCPCPLAPTTSQILTNFPKSAPSRFGKSLIKETTSLPPLSLLETMNKNLHRQNKRANKYKKFGI